MKPYDPAWDAPPEEWLTLDERNCFGLSADYARASHVRTPNSQLPDVVRAIVEYQLALAEPMVVVTFARLRREGLERDEAIHALGLVLSGHLDSALRDLPDRYRRNERCQEALRKLSTAKRRAS